MNYPEIAARSWAQIQSDPITPWTPPRSVHVPLNLPMSDHLLFCDCAFNAYVLPMIPDMNSRSIECVNQCTSLRVKLLSFSFGEQPYVPDFRQTEWSRDPRAVPVVRGVLEAEHLRYTLEYAVDPADSSLYVRVSVRNSDDLPQKAFVRLRTAEPMERDVFDYHYTSFRWDRSRWDKFGPAVDAPDVAEQGKWMLELEQDKTFPAESFNQKFRCGRPYFVQPEMQLNHLDGMLCFSAELAHGETASFTIRHRFGADAQKPPDSFETVLARVRADFDRLFSGCTEVDFGDSTENMRFQTLRYTSLQLLLSLNSPLYGKIIQPCQGGSSERFYVWVWEAMKSLRPMLNLGHTGPVKEVIRFIFQLQDGGFPPEGEFKTVSGAIGTTGPRWANATGSALLLASEYLILTDDPGFRQEYLPKMIRAAKWILGEVKATRRYLPDGSKALGFGVMPKCCATDADFGYAYAFTDSYSLAGVKRLIDLLKTADPLSCQQLEPECRQYEEDFRNAMESVRREDGFIDRKLSNDGNLFSGFNATCSAMETIGAGICSPLEPMLRSYITWTEKNMFDGLFCAPVFDGVSYIGNIESIMVPSWIRLGEWKKAWACAKIFRFYAMTQDLFIAQERFSPHDDAFTPWQPNASCNGRFLMMQTQRLLLEADGFVTLLGGISPLDFENADGSFLLKDLHTDHGMMTLSIRQGKLFLTWDNPLPAGTQLRIPEHFALIPDRDWKESAPGIWKTDDPIRNVSGELRLRQPMQ